MASVERGESPAPNHDGAVDLRELNLSAYDTDKSRNYLEHYRRELGLLEAPPAALLELGVRRGGSLLLWRDAFPGALVVGLDINELELDDPSGRVRTYAGFQQDTALLDQIAAENAPDGFDVIIDDASHIAQYTAVSFWHLFRHHLRPGGVYVLEDWSCGYWSDWPDGHSYTGSAAVVGGTSVREPRSGPDGATRGRVQSVQRRLRTAAPGIGRRLDSTPSLKALARKAYFRAEAMTVARRFPSHEYGMVGLVKQIVDATAVDVMKLHGDRGPDLPSASIDRVTVAPSQTFVFKRR